MESSTGIEDIQRACRLGDRSLLKDALDTHPEGLNQMDVTLGWAPLYRTVICGHVETTQLLLDVGADPDIKTKMGETPLHQAAYNSQYQISKLLLDYGANPNIQQNDGDTPLHHAAFKGDINMVSLLLKFKGNPNLPNLVFGRTPLHYAVDYNHVKVAKLMMKYAGSIEVKDMSGKTPFGLAKTLEMTNILTKAQSESEKSATSSPLNMPQLDPIDDIPSIPLHTFENITLSPLSSKNSSFIGTPTKEIAKLKEIEEMNNRLRENVKSSVEAIRIITHSRSVSSVFEPDAEKTESDIRLSSVPDKARTVSFGGSDKKGELYNWLVGMKLEELYEVLMLAGYDDVAQMASQVFSSIPISEETLKGIGIKKSGLRRRLLAALDEEARGAKSSRKLPKPSNNPLKCCVAPVANNIGFIHIPSLQS